jgi:photosystem II stability/assembly factor-like uncharacterized protein
LRKIIWDGSKYVAVGEKGTIVTSTDGINWKINDNSKQYYLVDVSSNGKADVATGTEGTIMTSTNGKDWSKCDSGMKQTIRSINNNGKMFVALAYENGKPFIIISEDGTNWKTTYAPNEYKDYSYVLWDGKGFIILGDDSTLVSTDGTSWEKINRNGMTDVNQVIYDGQKYIAAAIHGNLYVSMSASEWSRMEISEDYNNKLEPIKFNNVDKDKKDQSIIDSVSVNSISYGKKMYTLIGNSKYILISKDLNNFNPIESLTNYALTSITFGNGKFIAVGKCGTILTSEDGFEWAFRKSGTNYSLRKIIWDGSKYVAVGEKGTIITSIDGINWNINDSYKPYYLVDVSSNGKINVATGTEGTIMTSSDGKDWSKCDSGMKQTIRSITNNGKMFVALAYENGKPFIIISDDGTNWKTTYAPNEYEDYSYSLWDGKSFIILGDDSTLVSADGTSWEKINRNGMADINQVIYDGQRYIATAIHGSLSVSTSNEKWTRLEMKYITKIIPNVSGEVKVSQTNNVKVLINGAELDFDVNPVIESGRVLVPLRLIFESLGATVTWESKTKTVIAEKNNKRIKLVVDGKEAYLNNEPIKLDVPAGLKNNRTLVPLRFISESLGANVSWEGKTRTVTITYKY